MFGRDKTDDAAAWRSKALEVETRLAGFEEAVSVKRAELSEVLADHEAGDVEAAKRADRIKADIARLRSDEADARAALDGIRARLGSAEAAEQATAVETAWAECEGITRQIDKDADKVDEHLRQAASSLARIMGNLVRLRATTPSPPGFATLGPQEIRGLVLVLFDKAVAATDGIASNWSGFAASQLHEAPDLRAKLQEASLIYMQRRAAPAKDEAA